jgi:acyl carrier protein
VNYIPHYFYYNDVKSKVVPEIITWSLDDLAKVEKHDIHWVDKKIIQTIIQKVADIKEISSEEVTHNSKLVLDLYYDSLDLAELKSYVQSIYSWASNPPIWDLKTVGDIIIMAVWESEKVEPLKPCDWWKTPDSEEELYQKLT